MTDQSQDPEDAGSEGEQVYSKAYLRYALGLFLVVYIVNFIAVSYTHLTLPTIYSV